MRHRGAVPTAQDSVSIKSCKKSDHSVVLVFAIRHSLRPPACNLQQNIATADANAAGLQQVADAIKFYCIQILLFNAPKLQLHYELRRSGGIRIILTPGGSLLCAEISKHGHF